MPELFPPWPTLRHPLHRLAWLMIALPLIDLAMLGAFLRWAYVSHADIRDSVFHGRQRFSMMDGSLIERWGYAQQLVALLLLIGVAVLRRSALFATIGLLAVAVLLDDSLRLHERLGHALMVNAPGWSTAPATADLVAKLAVAALPAAAVLFSYAAGDPLERRSAHLVLAPLAMIGGFAVGVDFIHDLNLWTGGQTVSTLVEDGGELLAISALLVAALLTLIMSAAPVIRRRVGAEAGVAHQSAQA